MNDSILTSTKKILGVDESYTAFDLDILTHINTAFMTLNQLGIGPVEGFFVEDDTTTWSSFLLADPRLNSVRSYVYLKVRLLFDPPATSFHLSAIQDQLKEMEYRINLVRELDLYPFIPESMDEPNEEYEVVIDGGSP